jgi:transcriptional antiterminator NusG
MEEDQEAKFKVEYAIGDLVRVVDGPFRDSEGKIIGIDEEHGRVRVSIPVFGRDTELEIDSLQIQKI